MISLHRLDQGGHRCRQTRGADTVKRVSQELGGKSPNVILEDADFTKAGSGDVARRVQQLGPVLQRADTDDRAVEQDG